MLPMVCSDPVSMQLELEKSSFSAPATGQDRRRSSREMRRLNAWLGESAGGVVSQQQQVTVNSLSMHGVGISSAKPLEAGASHWLVIADDRMHLSTRVRIISTRLAKDGSCDAGAEFF